MDDKVRKAALTVKNVSEQLVTIAQAMEALRSTPLQDKTLYRLIADAAVQPAYGETRITRTIVKRVVEAIAALEQTHIKQPKGKSNG